MCCPCSSDSRSMQRFQDTLPEPYVATDVIYQTISSFQTKTVIWKGYRRGTSQARSKNNDNINNNDNEKVAIKGMRFCISNPNQLVPLFLREVLLGQILGHLKHPNLIGSQDAFIWPDRDEGASSPAFFFIAMILPWATTDMSEICYQFSQDLPRLNPHREEIAKMFVSGIIQGCTVLHHFGISHRDLKPANIFLYEDDVNDGRNNSNQHDDDDDEPSPPRVVVADYGLSRLLWRPSSTLDADDDNSSSSYEADRKYWTTVNDPKNETTVQILQKYQRSGHDQDKQVFFFEEKMTQSSAGENHQHHHYIFPTPSHLQNIHDKACNQRNNPICHGECCAFTDVCGTRFYRCPELLMRDYFYTDKIDTWALGCVFFELIGGGTRLFTNLSSSAKAVVMGSEMASAGILETILETLHVIPSSALVQSSLAPDGQLEETMGVQEMLNDLKRKHGDTFREVNPGEFVKYDWDRILNEKIEKVENNINNGSSLFSQECKDALDSMLQLDPRVRVAIGDLGKNSATRFFAHSNNNSNNEIKLESLEEILKQVYGTDDDAEEYNKKHQNQDAECADGDLTCDKKKTVNKFPFKPRWQKVYQMLAGCRDVQDALSLIQDPKVLRKCNPRGENDKNNNGNATKETSGCVIC